MPDSVFTTTAAIMDTVVSITAVGAGGDPKLQARVERAFGWFTQVEGVCSRFDQDSELMALCRVVGMAVPVSDLLFGALRMALEVARLSKGAFDPTVGLALERAGFNRNYRTGERLHTESDAARPPSYRDVRLDDARQTVALRRPLVLDLGAVAKGLAIDLAARELACYPGFAVEAGGDLFVGGHNDHGTNWRIGIKHPVQPTALIDRVEVRDLAVCTSAAYERRVGAGPITHHLLDPRRGESAAGVASVTVIALTAMLADALSTAAFVLGPEKGIALLEAANVDGLIITPTLAQKATKGYARHQTITGER
ncbi:MAG TPA: FAD:protein FMN transferase [Chloroflexota bacterium]|nr:FAD:protein FMN transferase [Chloroflexota bacterium]